MELAAGDLAKQYPSEERAGRVLARVKTIFWNRACVIR